ncbi:S-layer homology domain-containing protein [Paenibacillus sp. PR3]|uniref:S-layer homology domain-containing protein n=1 Tax=Paenibacillus terricola TaxID=2763503 RepID=A0ABR8MXI0_9BACL|nr:S-layer homology domain-containing protein [Paenibacillus terricola]MBD3920660.1 S-layer homology domain-containing protein [Paenibacillus terricola]
MNSSRTKPWRLSLAIVLLFVTWTAAVSEVHAAQVNVQKVVADRTKKAIVDQWLHYRPLGTDGNYMNEGNIYETVPQLAAPYAIGSIKQTFIEDGLNAANFVRYLAGLPDDLEADWSLEQQEQTAALLSAVNRVLSHTQKKPAGMEQSMFDLGNVGAGGSNLIKGSLTFYNHVLGYMSDSDESNIDRVGHRRWILNPLMRKTMFGMVYSAPDAKGTAYPYGTMYAFNTDRDPAEVSYDYVSWPSAGWFPQELFAVRDAWSVSLNADKYDNSRTSDIQVKLTRERDGRTWQFDSNDKDVSGHYFNVETSEYGIPFAVIFRPEGIGAFGDNDTFKVAISGLYDTSGQAAQLQFQTKFFNMLSSPVARYTIQLRKGETLQLGVRAGERTDGTAYVSGNSKIAAINSAGEIKGVAAGTTWVSVDSYTGRQNRVNIVVTDKAAAEQVSKWALKDYGKAKGNGLIDKTHDHSYQQPISRYDFTVLAIQMLETAASQYLYTEDVGFGNSPFKDTDDWRITWANRNGIIQGMGAQTFSPKTTITREQAASLMLNLYKQAKQTIGIDKDEPADMGLRFADDSRIAAWARTSVYRATTLSIMKGTGSNQFTPKGILTYEQTFVLLENLFELIEEQKNG